jgi:hypothetical protein
MHREIPRPENHRLAERRLPSAPAARRSWRRFSRSMAKAINIVYAHNDDMALGAVQAIQEAGLKPGTDITIVSDRRHQGSDPGRRRRQRSTARSSATRSSGPRFTTRSPSCSPARKSRRNPSTRTNSSTPPTPPRRSRRASIEAAPAFSRPLLCLTSANPWQPNPSSLSGDHQALSRRARARAEVDFTVRSGEDPRAARRKRRGQIHADQGADRRLFRPTRARITSTAAHSPRPRRRTPSASASAPFTRR